MEESDLIRKLHKALEDYFSAVQLQKTADLTKRPFLQPHFKKIDGLSKQLLPNADPRLRHFLLQKSYQKALSFLEKIDYQIK